MGIAWTPLIIPKGDDENVYLLVDDLGSYGEVWREVETIRTDLETVLNDLLSSQFSRPLRVVAFNISEGWSRDVSEDIAHELVRRCDLRPSELPSSLGDFVKRHANRDRPRPTPRHL